MAYHSIVFASHVPSHSFFRLRGLLHRPFFSTDPSLLQNAFSLGLVINYLFNEGMMYGEGLCPRERTLEVSPRLSRQAIVRFINSGHLRV